MRDVLKTERALWEAFAAGDACGMPTEFMLHEEILPLLGEHQEDFLPAACSFHHSDLPAGCVTDDTEQNLYLIAALRQEGLSVDTVVRALTAWIDETGAVEKKYIGPSSLKALNSIKAGTPAEEAGMGGTTCGGMMRTPAAVLWKADQDDASLAASIRTVLLPTHNTSEALEAAGAYGFALRAALEGKSMEDIFLEAERGGKLLMDLAPWHACAPSSVARLKQAPGLPRQEEALTRVLADVWGTGLPSADVCGAVFAVFAYAGADVRKALRFSRQLGGDTDTIAALAGALCAAYAGGHNLPEEDLKLLYRINEGLFAAKLPEVFTRAF